MLAIAEIPFHVLHVGHDLSAVAIAGQSLGHFIDLLCVGGEKRLFHLDGEPQRFFDHDELIVQGLERIDVLPPIERAIRIELPNALQIL
jgi:hypothetical protein